MLEYLAVDRRVLLGTEYPNSFTTQEHIRMNMQVPTYPFSLINSVLYYSTKAQVYRVEPQEMKAPTGALIETIFRDFDRVAFNQEPYQQWEDLSFDLQSLVDRYSKSKSLWAESVTDSGLIVWSSHPQPAVITRWSLASHNHPLVSGLISGVSIDHLGLSENGIMWSMDWVDHPHPIVDVCVYQIRSSVYRFCLDTTGSIYLVGPCNHDRRNRCSRIGFPHWVVQLLPSPNGDGLRCRCLDGSIVKFC